MPLDLTPPQWLQDCCSFWVERLALDDWEIVMGLSLAPGDDAGNQGYAESWQDRSFGRITLRLDIEDDFDCEVTLVHELLHLKHARVDHAVTSVIAPNLSSVPQEMIDSLYRGAVEPFIHSLARALVITRRQVHEVEEKGYEAENSVQV